MSILIRYTLGTRRSDRGGSEVQIEGATAIVFGGASGLGQATARRLAAEGASVTIADIAEEEAREVVGEIGGRAVRCDITDARATAAAIALAGDVRICVVCAGLATPAKLLGRDGPTPPEVFSRVIAVNLVGTLNVLGSAAHAMSSNSPDSAGERGVCVNTASIAAYEGQVGQVAYAASKGGVVALTLPVARELAGKGIRVVTVAPGLFDTPLLAGLPEEARTSLSATVPFPARLGEPAEYADLVAHIVRNPMLNGGVIRLDGALRMAPR
jgi:NAD(P)-dependent dehydrogenase (short-subunit alcohol dehydrogenase family)